MQSTNSSNLITRLSLIAIVAIASMSAQAQTPAEKSFPTDVVRCDDAD